jgi:hypothetical protein
VFFSKTKLASSTFSEPDQPDEIEHRSIVANFSLHVILKDTYKKVCFHPDIRVKIQQEHSCAQPVTP